MGVESFYIDIKIELGDAKAFKKLYESNDLYNSAFYYGVSVEGLNSEFAAGISSVIDNFLPANILIFSFLTEMKGKIGCFTIRTRDVERLFDFSNKTDFIDFMYNTWESKIDAAYSQLGTVLINPQNYYKTRNRLYRKYYKKI